MVAVSETPARFVGLVLHTRDVVASGAFYEALLGVTATPTALVVGEHTLAQLLPATDVPEKVAPGFVPVLACNDLDEAHFIARANHADCVVVPEGLVVTSANGARARVIVSDVDVDAPAWCELCAPDSDDALWLALGFWDRTVLDVDGHGMRLYVAREAPVASAQDHAAVREAVGGTWVPGFIIDDVTASTKRALELGARELVRGVSPFGPAAYLLDPCGAVFSLLEEASV
jgi:predicted enzyme related to lactoylglutathione lyase